MSEKSETMDMVNDLSDYMIDLKSKVKGEKPINIKQKCLILCQNYLEENWTQLTSNDIRPYSENRLKSELQLRHRVVTQTVFKEGTQAF
jgi:hypothetical protein